MKMGEKQMEGPEKIHKSRVTTSPLDAASVELGISATEIVQIVAEGRRSRPPMIAKAATGWPIAALSADELAAMEVAEDLDSYNQSTQLQERKL